MRPVIATGPEESAHLASPQLTDEQSNSTANAEFSRANAEFATANAEFSWANAEDSRANSKFSRANSVFARESSSKTRATAQVAIPFRRISQRAAAHPHCPTVSVRD
jgi:hypothetical protein